MMNFSALIALLFISVKCSIYHRLDSNGQNTLNAEDSLASTFGIFRITLKEADCKLSVQRFDKNERRYKNIGDYQSPSFNANCKNLTISNGTILTNTNATYMAVNNANSNFSTILTIDDEGIIRLVATSQG